MRIKVTRRIVSTITVQVPDELVDEMQKKYAIFLASKSINNKWWTETQFSTETLL